jgi:hypothetical protein
MVEALYKQPEYRATPVPEIPNHEAVIVLPAANSAPFVGDSIK